MFAARRNRPHTRVFRFSNAVPPGAMANGISSDSHSNETCVLCAGSVSIGTTVSTINVSQHIEFMTTADVYCSNSVTFTYADHSTNSNSIQPEQSHGTVSDFFEDYADVNDALSLLHDLEDDEEWKITDKVFSSSLQVASILMAHDIPRPGVFTHGPQSVVFNWSSKKTELYLTVSESRLSVLVSTPAGIKSRAELSGPDTTMKFLSALKRSQLAAPQT